jgi:hypothetical protein
MTTRNRGSLDPLLRSPKVALERLPVICKLETSSWFAFFLSLATVIYCQSQIRKGDLNSRIGGGDISSLSLDAR